MSALEHPTVLIVMLRISQPGDTGLGPHTHLAHVLETDINDC